MKACFDYQPEENVVISKSIRFHPDLTFFEKILFGELFAWSMKEPCPYSTRQLAQLYGVSENTVRAAINKLSELGMICVELVAHNNIREYRITVKEGM